MTSDDHRPRHQRAQRQVRARTAHPPVARCQHEDDDIVLVPGRDNQISDVLWAALISDPKFVQDFVASGIMTVMSS
jgi:hypothetical protein